MHRGDGRAFLVGAAGLAVIGLLASGADAAAALQPLAGSFAGLLFAIGTIDAGILAVPVLTGSAASALSEVFGWKWGCIMRGTGRSPTTPRSSHPPS